MSATTSCDAAHVQDFARHNDGESAPAANVVTPFPRPRRAPPQPPNAEALARAARAAAAFELASQLIQTALRDLSLSGVRLTPDAVRRVRAASATLDLRSLEIEQIIEPAVVGGSAASATS